jgi:hypothetical protein
VRHKDDYEVVASEGEKEWGSVGMLGTLQNASKLIGKAHILHDRQQDALL